MLIFLAMILSMCFRFQHTNYLKMFFESLSNVISNKIFSVHCIF